MRLIFLYIIFLFFTSCFPSAARNLDKRDSYLYNKTGFRPEKQTPDYYYRAPVQRPKSYPVTNSNGPTKQYPPASRYYKNPYSLKPPQQYPYYDSDEYYVPPQGGQANQDYQKQGPQSPASSTNYQEQLY